MLERLRLIQCRLTHLGYYYFSSLPDQKNKKLKEQSPSHCISVATLKWLYIAVNPHLFVTSPASSSFFPLLPFLHQWAALPFYATPIVLLLCYPEMHVGCNKLVLHSALVWDWVKGCVMKPTIKYFIPQKMQFYLLYPLHLTMDDKYSSLPRS